MMKVPIGAALFAAQIAAPAAASGGEARRDVRVAVSDLDLSTREGIAALDRRLVKAVAKACGTAHSLDPDKLNEMYRCRDDARARAMAQRNAILGDAIGTPAFAANALK
jgi:UrcA family protein